MKKLLFVVLASLMLFGCQKKDENVNLTQDVVFSIDKVDLSGGFKSVPWGCYTDVNGNVLEPASAMITITYGDPLVTEIFEPLVFRLDGLLYTQVIKLPVGTYTVTEVNLYDAAHLMLMGTPHENSDYSEYVSKPVPFEFDVEDFAKAEIAVEVLCYLPENHDYFGFSWFNITEIAVREFCFFGDICLDGDTYSPDDYLYSLYDVAQQPLGTQLDMPAIFKMHVYKDNVEVPNSPFTNATATAGFGVGAPLCVQYPDKLNVQEEEFTFELWILVKNAGGSFSYQPYYTFFSMDDGALMLEDQTTPVDVPNDGIVDFVVGTCNDSDTDLQLSWLPALTEIFVYAEDLATGYQDVFTDPSKWFFYNDETDVIDNTLGSIVATPGINGSVQISVSGSERRNLATYQFAAVPLADITTFLFATYNPSAGNGGSENRSGYLNFNIDFDGSDNWQRRLAYVPSVNGTVEQDNWQGWDAINGGAALWWWSGFAANGNQWPDGDVNEYRTWSDLITSFPNIRTRATDSWMGIRVGEPYTDGYTENMDVFRFGVNGTSIKYDFVN